LGDDGADGAPALVMHFNSLLNLLAPMLFTACSLNEQGVAGGSLCVSLNCLWGPQ